MPGAADRAKAATVGEMASRAQYEVMQAGREVVQRTATRWRRVTDGSPCGFCAMLASRGPVYRSQESAEGYHAHCGCTAEPFDGDPAEWEPTPDEQRFIDAYRESYRTGIKSKDLADRIEARLAEVPDPPVRFGKVLTDATAPRATPLKGVGGKPLSRKIWEDAPFSRADGDYRYIADPDDRATGVLQFWTDTEAAAKKAALNIKAGRAPLEGVDLTDGSFSHLIGEGYEVADLEADIVATAHKLIGWESTETSLGTVYKGVQFPGAQTWEDVKALLRDGDWAYSSATPRAEHAWRYAGRPDRTRSVIFEIEDARGIQLDSVGDHAIEREFLLSGRVEIRGYEFRPDPDGYGDRLYVKARYIR
jgi:hypothetical protein